ncbi:TldD/PmbA family protein [Sporosarcina gallistercoris]|uniref:TldD/PmbA family protein n=1 Tax=Sporosarcina gallistercoris TaxID=2762245 RepID=A0ABR8PIQ0_9BACL|nr:TldD/PmbA family protein [Sporosarcina gallistercoris]MBD7908063.1 TldD/PmbA family protein [Sporosarcina gallistercoris]
MDIQTFQGELLTKAKDSGFEEAEVYFENSISFQVSIFEGEIDSYETSDEGGLGFRGLYHGKMGYAYTEKIDVDSISFLIDGAKVNAEVLDEDDGSDIFEGSDNYSQHSSFNDVLANISIPEKIAFIKEVEKKTLAYDPRIVTLNYCVLQDFTRERVLANNKGLSLQDKMNGLIVFISVVAKQGEEMKTGGAVRLTRDFSSLDAEEIAKEAAEEALSLLGEKSIPSRKYPIIMRHDASASLLAAFTSVFSAEEAQKDQSLLKDKVGEGIGAENFTLIDDPFHPEALTSSHFDGEGVATQKTTIISKGTLKTLLHNRQTSKLDGVESTGHASKPSYKSTLSVAPNHVYVVKGEKSLSDMIASIEDGVLIIELSGLHSGTNTISGDFSVAATGFHIVNGEISSAVKQMTIAGNFFDYMKSIEAVGSDLKFVPGGYGSPSLKVKELSVTVD